MKFRSLHPCQGLNRSALQSHPYRSPKRPRAALPPTTTTIHKPPKTQNYRRPDAITGLLRGATPDNGHATTKRDYRDPLTSSH